MSAAAAAATAAAAAAASASACVPVGVAACALPRALATALAIRTHPLHHNSNSSINMVHARFLHGAARSRVNATRSGARPSLASPSRRPAAVRLATSIQHTTPGNMPGASMQQQTARPFGSSSRLQSALVGLRSLLRGSRVPTSAPLETHLIALLTHQQQHAEHLSSLPAVSASASVHTSARSPKDPPPFPFKSPDLGPTPSSKTAGSNGATAAATLGREQRATPAAAAGGGGGGGSLPPLPPSPAHASPVQPPPHGADSIADGSVAKDHAHSHTYARQAREISSALLATLSHSSKAQIRRLLLLMAGVLGLGGLLIYIFRDPLKGHLSEQTADVAKRSLTSSEVQMQVNVLSADVVRQLLDNPAVMAQCSAFVARLMAQTETRQAVVQLLQATANDPQSLLVLSRLASQLLADLMAKPETLAQLTQLLRAAITTPGNEQALQILFKSFALDPKTQSMVADLAKRAAMDTLHDASVQAAAKQFMKDVTADQSVQKSTGDAMWNAIKYSLKPSWMAGSAAHGDAASRTAAAPPAAAAGTEGAPAAAMNAVTDKTTEMNTTQQVATPATPADAPVDATPVAVISPGVAAVTIHPTPESPSLLLAPPQPPIAPPSA